MSTASDEAGSRPDRQPQRRMMKPDGAYIHEENDLCASVGCIPVPVVAAPAESAKKCKYGDPICPCQDGDACHYEGKNPWPAPKCAICGSSSDATVHNVPTYQRVPGGYGHPFKFNSVASAPAESPAPQLFKSKPLPDCVCGNSAILDMNLHDCDCDRRLMYEYNCMVTHRYYEEGYMAALRQPVSGSDSAASPATEKEK